jgi:hypothetical protein
VEALFAFLDLLATPPHRHPRWGAAWVAARHPVLLGRAVRAIRQLPTVDVELSDSPLGRRLRRQLRGRIGVLSTARYARAVLPLPTDPAEYLRGRSRQALRTNLNAARDRYGISCGQIQDLDEQRARFIELLTERRWGSDPLRRLALEHGVEPGLGCCYAAVGADHRTKALVVTFEDEVCARLVWMMATPDQEQASAARYALSAHLAEALIDRGVRVLFVLEAPSSSAGVRYFQERLGYSWANLRLSTRPR